LAWLFPLAGRFTDLHFLIFAVFEGYNIDGLVKSRFYPVFVIPAKAGIQLNQAVLDSRLRGSDGFSDFLRVHQE
jgi:hypothetical protein